jgi:hypothetical protein
MKKLNETKLKQFAVPFARLKQWQVIVILSVIVAVFFRDILLGKSYFWEDFVYQYYAFRNFAAVSLANGTLPLWNPYTFSGMPFQADIQTALFYIPNLILTIFVSGGKLYFLWVEVLIIVHFVLAGYGMFLFTREIGLERPYALFSGIAFMLSGFMIMQVIHQTFICQVAWTPFLLLFFRRMLFKKSVFWMIVTGIVLGHAILAGSPQFTVYIFLLLLGYFVFEMLPLVRSSRPGQLVLLAGLAAGVIIIAIGLTAMQLLPTMEMAKLSQRAEISFDKSSEGSLQYRQLLTLISPKYFGASGAGGSTYWLGENYWEYWETCIYLGLIPLIAVLASFFLLKKERYVAFFIGVVVFGFLYSLGNNFVFHSIFFQFIPGFDKFRVPGRMSFLFTVGSGVLGGFGLRYLLEVGRVNKKKTQLFLVTVALCGIVVWIFGQAGIFQPTNNARAYEQIHPLVGDATLVPMILLLVACGLFLAYQRNKISAKAMVVIIIVFHVIDMNIFGFDQNNGHLNPETYYSKGSDLVGMLKEEGKSEYFRINSRLGGAMLLDRNQGMVDRIFTCEGYTPLALQRNYPVGKYSYDLLNAKYRIKVDSVNRTMGIQLSQGYFPRAFLVRHSRVFTDEASEKSYMFSDSFQPAKEVLLEEDPHFPISGIDTVGPSRATVTSFDLDEIKMDVSVRDNFFLVVSEIFYPGWRAVVDGKEQKIFRADWCLRALTLPAGEHHVEMKFEPSSFYKGVLITGATIFLAMVGGIISYRRENKPAVPTSSS